MLGSQVPSLIESQERNFTLSPSVPSEAAPACEGPGFQPTGCWSKGPRQELATIQAGPSVLQVHGKGTQSRIRPSKTSGRSSEAAPSWRQSPSGGCWCPGGADDTGRECCPLGKQGTTLRHGLTQGSLPQPSRPQTVLPGSPGGDARLGPTPHVP